TSSTTTTTSSTTTTTASTTSTTTSTATTSTSTTTTATSSTTTTTQALGRALKLGSSNAYVTFGSTCVGATCSLGFDRFTIETWFRRDGVGVPATTGTNGLPSFIPLVTKGAAQSENSNVDA